MIRKLDYGTLIEHWNGSTWSASSVDAITGFRVFAIFSSNVQSVMSELAILMISIPSSTQRSTLRSSNGVVDFIDIGVGYHRWPTFNVADMAVTTGAILLAWVLWVEDRAPSRRAAPLPEM